MEDINIGAISEALNNKIDLPMGDSQDGIDFVVDWQNPTAENSYTWYRKYKSGWVEQGGQSGVGADEVYTASLPVEMANTNYQTSITLYADTAAVNNVIYGVYFTAWNRTTTSFMFKRFNTSACMQMWQVSGYAA